MNRSGLFALVSLSVAVGLPGNLLAQSDEAPPRLRVSSNHLEWDGAIDRYYALELSGDMLNWSPTGLAWIGGGDALQAELTELFGENLSPGQFARIVRYDEESTADEDLDGIPTWWEIRHQTGHHIANAQADDDTDSLSNLEEFQAGTDPQDEDSDNDGMVDADEVEANRDPLDDSDGLLDLIIAPSRTSGVAPLYVFFDATPTHGLNSRNDLANADFAWSFDTTNTDPNGSWEQTRGMVAAHVFEEPGTYTVSCTLTAPDGSIETETITIEVTPFAGTTYYVTSDGSDTNTGLSESEAWRTANHALGQLGPSERVLFRRGDTFEEVEVILNGLSGGPMIIGAFGEGEAPVLDGAAEATVITVNATDDIRVMDLRLNANGVEASRGLRCETGSANVLALRLHIEGGAAMALYQDESDLYGVFDCYLHRAGSLGIFSSDGTRFAWVGNTLDNLQGFPQAEHGMRVQAGEKQFIAHSTFTRMRETKTAMTIRGDHQRHVMIYRNVMDRILSVNPTNDLAVQAIYHVCVEGNYVGQNADYIGFRYEPSLTGINVEANRVVVRNNIIDGYRRAVSIHISNPEVVSDSVDIYHNTANWRPVSPNSRDGGNLAVVSDSSNVTIRNNLISAATLGQANIFGGDNNTGVIVEDNLATDEPLYLVDPLPNSASHTNDPENYSLTTNSPAIGAGANDTPVFFDFYGNPRSEEAPDVGAFEF